MDELEESRSARKALSRLVVVALVSGLAIDGVKARERGDDDYGHHHCAHDHFDQQEAVLLAPEKTLGPPGRIEESSHHHKDYRVSFVSYRNGVGTPRPRLERASGR